MQRRASGWALGLTFLLCFGPLLFLFLSGSTAPGTGGDSDSIGLPLFCVMLRNSVAVAGGATMVALILAFPLAVVVFRLAVPCRTLFRAVLLAGAVLPLHMYAAAWFRRIGLPAAGPDPSVLLWTRGGEWGRIVQAALITGIARTPLTAVLVGLSLWNVDPENEEAAWLNVHRWGVVRHVLLRHLLGGALFAGSVTFGLSLGEIAVTDMLALRTLAEEAYMQFQLTLEPGRSALAGMVVFVPILICWVCLLLTGPAKHLGALAPRYANQSVVFRDTGARTRWLLFGLVCLILAITLVVPLVELMPAVGGVGAFLGYVKGFLPEFTFSILSAAAAGFLSVCLAFPLAHVLSKARVGRVGLAVALGGLFVPGSALGIALVKLFNRGGMCGWIYSSPLILVLGQALRFFPLTLIVLYIFLWGSPRQYRDMAAADGLSFARALWHVHLPINRRPLLLTWAVALIWCLGELDTSVIVCPPGTTTLSIRIFTMLHYGVYSEVASACLLMAGVLFLSVSAVLAMAGRSGA